MDAEPVKEAADPAREAEKAPPTVLHGTLTVEVPGGETMVLKTTFDSGSNTDAVSEKVAIQLKKLVGFSLIRTRSLGWENSGPKPPNSVLRARVEPSPRRQDTMYSWSGSGAGPLQYVPVFWDRCP